MLKHHNASFLSLSISRFYANPCTNVVQDIVQLTPRQASRASFQVTPTPHTTNAPPVRGKQKARPREILGSRNALVPVVFVLVVQVAIVDVVDVVAVLDSNVAAALAVLVIMSLVNDVLVGLYALVPVVFVLVVQVAIVSVVDVVAVLDSNVAAALAVLVIVALVNDVCHGGVLSFHGSIALLLLKKMMLLFRFESETS